VVKQYHVAGNTLVNSYFKIQNNDDRDFAPKMIFFWWKFFESLGYVVNRCQFWGKKFSFSSSFLLTDTNTLFFLGGFGINTLAYRVHPKRAQVWAQYCGNPEVAQLEGTPVMLFWSWHSNTAYADIQTIEDRTQHTSMITILLWIFIFHCLC